jgi:hypothetical protein
MNRRARKKQKTCQREPRKAFKRSQRTSPEQTEMRDDSDEEEEMKVLRDKGVILDSLIDIRKETDCLLELEDLCNESIMIESLFLSQIDILGKLVEKADHRLFQGGYPKIEDPCIGIKYQIEKFNKVRADAQSILGEVRCKQ